MSATRPTNDSRLYRRAAAAPHTSRARRCRRAFGFERLEDRQLMAYAPELVMDVNAGTRSSDPAHVKAAGDVFYFVADDGLHGMELWKSDGTTSGTAMLKDIRAGSSGSWPDNLTYVSETLYFSAYGPESGTLARLRKTDGSAEGTVRVKDVAVSPNAAFFSWQNLLYFNGMDVTTGFVSWWRSDGTEEGTLPLKDFAPLDISGGVDRYLLVDGDEFFFVAPGGLWRSDGTAEGTSLIAPRTPNFLIKFDGLYYFDGSFGGDYAIWRTDGTPGGTVVFKSFTSPQRVNEIRLTGDRFVFHTNGQLWSSDGTAEGTQLLITLNIVFNGSPSYFVEFNGGVYFLVRPLGDVPSEIWKTDGTPEGTRRVTFVSRHPNGTGTRVYPLGDKLFLTHNDGIHGIEPWFIDEDDGFRSAGDVAPGTSTSDPRDFREVNATTYFAAQNNLVGRELWRVAPRANTPSATDANTRAGIPTLSGLVVTRNAADGSEVSHVKVTGITNGRLFLNDGVTQVTNGQFVPFDEAARGFKFMPAEGFVGTTSFMVQASTSASDAGLGGEAVTASITVLAGLGTAGDDRFRLRTSADGSTLEIHDNNLPESMPIFTWPMNATIPLPINTLAGNDHITVELARGANGPAAGIVFDGGSGDNSVHVFSGRVLMDSFATGGAMRIAIRGGANDPQLVTNHFDHVSLTIIGGDASILPGGQQAAIFTNFDMFVGNTLDVADNGVVFQPIEVSKPTLLTRVTTYVKAGYADGAWDGGGIMSTTAATSGMTTTLALADNAVLRLTELGGVPVDENSILLKYTYYGDIDLNDEVDANDLTVFANNFGRTTGATQIDGDIDFDGDVDADDLTVFANNFGNGVGAPLAAAAPKDAGRIPSFPSSAWERTPAKLRFASAADVLDVPPLSSPTKQSFGDGGSQAELGNQRLVDLLAETIAADAVASSSDNLADARLAASRKATIADALWADASW
jgi:ELWxxDGT repeat protein